MLLGSKVCGSWESENLLVNSCNAEPPTENVLCPPHPETG